MPCNCFFYFCACAPTKKCGPLAVADVTARRFRCSAAVRPSKPLTPHTISAAGHQPIRARHEHPAHDLGGGSGVVNVGEFASADFVLFQSSSGAIRAISFFLRLRRIVLLPGASTNPPSCSIIRSTHHSNRTGNPLHQYIDRSIGGRRNLFGGV